MGTYQDSKYRKARRRYVCARCGKGIPAGFEYLAYAAGQRNTIKICMRCSVKRVQVGPMAGRLQFNVACVRKQCGLDDD